MRALIHDLHARTHARPTLWMPVHSSRLARRIWGSRLWGIRPPMMMAKRNRLPVNKIFSAPCSCNRAAA